MNDDSLIVGQAAIFLRIGILCMNVKTAVEHERGSKDPPFLLLLCRWLRGWIHEDTMGVYSRLCH